MKITGLKTILAGAQPDMGGRRRNWIYVKVFTDDGIEGIGEAFNTGLDEATESVINSYGRYLIDKDPTRIIHHWEAIYRSSRFPLGTVMLGALSALEIALWDITGKRYGVPIHKLFGGPSRDKIRVYTSLFFHGEVGSPEQLAKTAKKVVDKGYSAIKISPQPPGYTEKKTDTIIREAFDRVKAVRDAVGDDVDICLDYSGTEFSPINAIKMAVTLEPLKPFFFEEAIPHENVPAMAEVKAKTRIPIATGERLLTKYNFRELIERRAVDIIQPDPIVCGGILETLKIAAMAEPYYITVAPHNPFSPVCTAVCAQVDACIPNFLIQEYKPDDKPPRSDAVIKPLKLEGGYLKLPADPGLGVELNEEALSKYPYQRYDRPVLFREDGSIGLPT